MVAPAAPTKETSDGFSLPLLDDSIQATLHAERERMMREAGLTVDEFVALL